jgi:hypothetical protein
MTKAFGAFQHGGEKRKRPRLRLESRDRFNSLDDKFAIKRIAKCLRMWQAGLMAKSKLTAREKSRQERERAKSIEDRSRQLMRKAAQLQENIRHEDIRQAAAGIAKQAIEGK